MGTRISAAFDGGHTAPLHVKMKKMLASPCPFCRTPFSIKPENHYEELMKRVDAGDAKAMYHLGIKLVNPMGPIEADRKNCRVKWNAIILLT